MPLIQFGQQIEELPRERYDDDLVKALIKYVNEHVSIFDVLDLYGIRYPYPRGQSQKVRCIFPDHPDRNPSAKIDAAKNRYTCYSRCDGGDPIFVAKKLGGHASIGQAVLFLDQALKLNLAAVDLKLRAPEEDPMFYKKEARRLEDSLLEKALSIRNLSTPTAQHRGIQKKVDEVWNEWDDEANASRWARSPENLYLLHIKLLGVLEALEYGTGELRRLFEEDEDDQFEFRRDDVYTPSLEPDQTRVVARFCPVP